MRKRDNRQVYKVGKDTVFKTLFVYLYNVFRKLFSAFKKQIISPSKGSCVLESRGLRSHDCIVKFLNFYNFLFLNFKFLNEL